MFQRAFVSCLLLGSLLAVGCSSDDSEPDTSGGGSAGTSGGGGDSAIPSCVLTIVQDKCQRCHGDPLKHGAPVAFFTANDFQASYFESDLTWAEVAADRVEDETMPFVALNNLPDPITPPVEPLTPDEKTTLLAWLKAGALPDDATVCR